ncbi:hypothetical protein BDZ88DRAFT_406416 [Geranomyces variabilis]|nr:hypothetical protein BDZ88DRAFT_406416 [Geranomyces variabilis]
MLSCFCPVSAISILLGLSGPSLLDSKLRSAESAAFLARVSVRELACTFALNNRSFRDNSASLGKGPRWLPKGFPAIVAMSAAG